MNVEHSAQGTVTRTLEHLETERRRLALGVREGEKTAQKELLQVENRIAAIHRKRELDALAEEAAREREKDRQRREAELDQKRTQKKRARVEHERDQALREIERRVEELPDLCRTAIDLEGQANTLGRQLGLTIHDRRLKGRIADFVCWRLGPVLSPDIPMPLSALRRPLIEKEKNDEAK